MKKLVIIFFVLALSISALAVAGCGGNGDAADDPEKVVQDFMRATLDGDADAVYEMLSAPSKTEVTDRQELVEGWDLVADFKVGKGTISGDRATVPTTFIFTDAEGGMDFTFDMILVKEGAIWKVSLLETEASMDDAFEKLMEEFELPE